MKSQQFTFTISNMKSVLFGIVIIALVFIGHAQEQKDFDQKDNFKGGSIVTNFDNETIEYKFQSLEDLNEEIDSIVKEIDLQGGKSTKDCKVSIELKLEIGEGIETVSLSQKIVINCFKQDTTVITKKLKAVLLAAVIG